LVKQILQIMKTRFLFPYRSRILGYICVLAYLPIMVFKKILHHGYNNIGLKVQLEESTSLLNSEHILSAIAVAVVIIGLLLIAFSKEKIEDEQILQLRLDSLQWAVYFNYAMLVITLFVLSNMHYREILVLNLWAPLVFFIIRFRWVIFRFNRLAQTEN
jgi:hypothetical protein